MLLLELRVLNGLHAQRQRVLVLGVGGARRGDVPVQWHIHFEFLLCRRRYYALMAIRHFHVSLLVHHINFGEPVLNLES